MSHTLRSCMKSPILGLFKCAEGLTVKELPTTDYPVPGAGRLESQFGV